MVSNRARHHLIQPFNTFLRLLLALAIAIPSSLVHTGKVYAEAPTAVDDSSFITNEDNALEVTAPGVLGNDTDPEVEPLTAIKVSDPAHGSVTLNSDGSFTYTPNENFNGSDLFTYKANDGTADSNIATVSIAITAVNDAPVLNPVGNKSIDQLGELTFAASASDIDSGSLTFSLDSAPGGAGINAASGAFSWTPSETPGDYPFNVCVSDGSLNDCESITVTVHEQNVAPVLGAIGSRNLEELTELGFTATANDTNTPADTLAFSLAGAPAGAGIDNGTGVFTWTPTEAQGPGNHNFSIRVCDDGTPVYCDDESITVSVSEVNAAPILNAIGGKTVNETTELTFTATAADEDLPANTLTFSLTGEPAGAGIDGSTGVFTWTPSEAQGPGSYPLDVCVSDSSLNDCETITVTVNEINNAPVLAAIGSQSVTELSILIFTASAADSDTGSTLSFSLANGASGSIPAGAAIDPSSGAFTWMPTEAQGPDLYQFDVCVSDGSLNDCETIMVTVNEANVAPVLTSIGSQTINELSLLSFTASATDADLPANTLTFSLEAGTSGSVPAGAAIGNTTGEFTWTPMEAQGQGQHTFDICVSDGSANDCETITVTVNEVNVAPVCSAVSLTTNEDTEGQADPSCTDADGNPMTYSIVSQPANGTASVAAGRLVYIPGADYNGADSFTYLANDGVLDSNTATASVTVSAANDAPVLSTIGNKNTAEQIELTFTATATDVDIPADTLTFNLEAGISGSVPAGAAIVPATGVFTWTPTEVQGPGSYTFDVCVSDGSLSDCETVSVIVSEANAAPVLDPIGGKSVAELALLSFTATATDADIPANTLTFSLTSAPTGAAITSGGDFTWTPTEAQGPGSYPFDVCVSDGSLSDCETITIAVSEVNVAPVLASIGSKVTAELAQLSFTAVATDADVPANTLTFSLADGTSGTIPTGAAIVLATGDFTWTPAEVQGPGSYQFDVCVSDGSLSDCETITVTISEANAAPVLDPIGGKSTAELALLSFTATATDADVPANTLTFSLADGTSGSVPAGTTIVPATGAFTWTPAEAQGPGLFTFDVCVSDGSLNDCETITVTVSEANAAPVLDLIGSKSTAELALLSFTATATDADIPANTLAFSLTSAPTGAVITSGGDFTWTPNETQGPGSYPFDVCASDGSLSDCETITVSVNETNTAPVLSPIGLKSTAELAELAFTATAVDADIPANALTYSLTSAPAGAGITSGGDFTWTPTEAQGPDSHQFDVCVSDGSLNDCETITVSVSEANVAPVLASIGNKNNNELVELTFTATATDVDLPANTLTFGLEAGTSGSVPAGAEIVPATGVFTWTPTEVQGPGSYPFDVCVSDGSLSDCETITVALNEVNTAPVLAAIGSKSIAELGILSFTANAADSDMPVNTKTYSLSGAPSGASINTTTGDFTWTPTEAQGPSSYTFDVCVSDGSLVDCETITASVSEVNVAPVLASIGSKITAELALLSFTAVATDADIPVNTQTFSLADGTSGTIPAGAAIIPSTGVFTWTPTEAQGPGSYLFDVCVSDGSLNDCETITVTVNEANVAPVLGSIGSRSVNELALLNFTATATDADIPVQTLTFNLSTGVSGSIPAGAAINPSTGAFTWTPTEAQGPGIYSFDICVSDGIVSDCESVTVTVNEDNTAPILSSIGNKNVNELVQLNFTATAADTDLPEQTLTFSLTGAPAGAGITSGGVFTWTPSEAQGPGSYTFDVCVNDISLNDCETITVNVGDVNVAPVLDSIGGKSINELAELSFTATAADTDIPANTLTFSLVDKPTGAAIAAATGVFTWTPTEAQGPGSYSFDVCVSDGILKYCETITVTVEEVNSAPVLASIGSKSVVEMSELSFTASASDVDIPTQTLTFSLSGEPAGAGVNSTTGAFSWTPTDDQGPGSYTFDVCTSDGAMNDCETITVTVMSFINQAPECSGVTLTADEDIEGQTDPSCTDFEGDQLTYSIAAQPAHGTATVTAGKLAYTSDENYNGSDSFEYQAFDGLLYSSEATVTVTVNPVNDTPICASVTLTTNKNTVGQVNPNCSDVDNASLTYSIAVQPAHGSADVQAGTLAYTPDFAYFGTDSFTYTASDGSLESNSANAAVTVIDASTGAGAPSIPALLLPANNALLINLTPRLDWSNSSIPTGALFDHYQLQIATDSTFTAIAADQNSLISESQPSLELSRNTLYYWRVRAFNTEGRYSGWSTPRTFREAMLAPDLLVPAHDSKPINLRPLFDWEDVAGASSYTIQISRYSNMSYPSVNSATTDSEYLPTKDLLKGRILFWRVRANGANGPSPWSELWIINSPNPPSRPAPQSPANSALLIYLTPRLDWSTSSIPTGTGFDHYQIQVATDNLFLDPLIDIPVTPLYDPAHSYFDILEGALSVNTRYYWRVRAINTDGQYSSWSELRYFREAMDPPTLLSPVKSEVPKSLRPVFDWEDVSGATNYTIQVTEYGSMILPLVNATVTDSTYIPVKDLPRNVKLYWRVRANGDNGPSLWSTVWTITSPNPPTVPNLLAPANNALLTDLTPVLDWGDSTIQPGGANFDYYLLQVAKDSRFTDLVYEQQLTERTSSSFSIVIDLLTNTRYYWRVRAFNEKGECSSWSTVRYFRESILAPELITPLKDATVDNLRPVFDWEDTDGASTYTIQVSLYSNMSTPILNKTSLGTFSFYMPTENLPKNKTLYWRVKANGDNGPSPWSQMRNFQILLP